MKKLTKKYIFKQKLKGKPIIVLVEEGHGRWATKKDVEILYECGIIIPFKDSVWTSQNQSITTHEILTYLIPFDYNHGPITRLPKGQIMPCPRDLNVTD